MNNLTKIIKRTGKGMLFFVFVGALIGSMYAIASIHWTPKMLILPGIMVFLLICYAIGGD